MGGVSRYVQNRSYNTQLYVAQLRIMPYILELLTKQKVKSYTVLTFFCKCWIQLSTDYIYSVMQKLLDTRSNMLSFKHQVTSLLLCMYWCTCALTHIHNSRVSELENLAIQYFNRLQSPMLMPVFLLFKTGSSEFWWASPTHLQFHWSLSAYSGFVFNYLRLVVSVLCGMRPFFNHVMYFMLLKSVCILSKVNFCASCAFWSYLSNFWNEVHILHRK